MTNRTFRQTGQPDQAIFFHEGNEHGESWADCWTWNQKKQFITQFKCLTALGSNNILHSSPQLSLSNVVGQVIRLEIWQVICPLDSAGKHTTKCRKCSLRMWKMCESLEDELKTLMALTNTFWIETLYTWHKFGKGISMENNWTKPILLVTAPE